MSVKALFQPRFNLLEKKYVASRIACLVLASLLVMYLFPLQTRGVIVSLISGGFAILFIVQFFRQSPVLNFILGGIMFLTGIYFCFAVMSEFNEFEIVTSSAKQLLIFGLGTCFSVMMLAFLMIWRALLD